MLLKFENVNLNSIKNKINNNNRMIVYLYFNYYYFLDAEFREKLNSIKLQYAVNSDADVNLQDDYYPYCRMKLKEQNDIVHILNEFNNQIYKYILYP